MIDLSPCRVTGAVRANRVRVLWNAGTLYVVNTLGQVKTYPVPEQPIRHNSGFTFTTSSGNQGTFYVSGCSCGTAGNLARIPLANIILQTHAAGATP